MKVIFNNHTDHTAYIAIVNYDMISKYIDEPVIFELEAHQQCFYETTPEYSLCGVINNKYNLYNRTFNDVEHHLRSNPSTENMNWFITRRSNHMVQYPNIPPAKICTHNLLKEFTLNTLVKQYDEYYLTEIKEPCTKKFMKNAVPIRRSLANEAEILELEKTIC